MNKLNYVVPPLLAMSFFSNAATAPTSSVRFVPTALGTTQYELFSFTRFGVVPVGPELNSAERRMLVDLIKAKDQANLIAHSGIDEGQQFSLSLPPLQQKSYKVLAPKLLDRLKACIRAMPEESAVHLIAGLAGVESLTDETVNARIKVDFNKAVAGKCAVTSNDIDTRPFEERALAAVESILTGEFSVWLGGGNYTSLLQSIGDNIFGKQGAIFESVAYDYLKNTMTATITGMDMTEGFAQLVRPEGFSTFVDFLVMAKTKSSAPTPVIEAISEKCLASVSDLFKPFSLQKCGSDAYSLKTIAIGDVAGTLVSAGGGQ